MLTAFWMPLIIFGSLIRETPPAARMSAGIRSSAITVQAPAASAIFACSGVVTSMMTPPLSIWASSLFSFTCVWFSMVKNLLFSDKIQANRLFHWRICKNLLYSKYTANWPVVNTQLKPFQSGQMEREAFSCSPIRLRISGQNPYTNTSINASEMT